MEFLENLKIRQYNITRLYNELSALIEDNLLESADIDKAWHWLNVDGLSVDEILDRLPH